MSPMKSASYIFVLCLFVSSLSAAPVDSEDLPKGKGYTYKEAKGVPREIEVLFPEGHEASNEAKPGIILFHGGGWGGGSRQAFSYQCDYFASRGLVAATVTYRLATKENSAKLKEGESRKRVCIPDAKSAIRWFKENAAELGVDPKRIIAGGGSAGGHISLIATTSPSMNDKKDPKGIDTSVVAYVLFNPALRESDGADPAIDVIQHLCVGFPPVIAFFGSEDTWLEGWNPAYAKLKALGNTSVEWQMAEGEKHAFFNNQPWADITLSAADRFLEKLGYLEGEPTLSPPETGEGLVKQP